MTNTTRFIEFKKLNNLLIDKVYIIPYTIDKIEENDNIYEKAYTLLNISNGIPTLCSFESDIDKDDILEDVIANQLEKDTYGLLEINPDDVYNDGWVLYLNNNENKYHEIVVFICINVNLFNICSEFRNKFIASVKKKERCDLTHLVWCEQTKFFYIIRDTDYLDDEGNRKQKADGNIQMDDVLKNIYKYKDDEKNKVFSIILNDNGYIPQYVTKYPPLDPFLKAILQNGIEEKVDFFFTYNY